MTLGDNNCFTDSSIKNSIPQLSVEVAFWIRDCIYAQQHLVVPAFVEKKLENFMLAHFFVQKIFDFLEGIQG